jgi:hypothetical protein
VKETGCGNSGRAVVAVQVKIETGMHIEHDAVNYKQNSQK